MSFSCDDIQDLSIKVRYSIDKDINRESSGVILRPKNETEYFFIFTTKHSFKKKDNQTYKDVEIDTLNISNIFLKYQDNPEFQPLKIIDTKHDLVILIIKNSLCQKYNLKRIKILQGKYKNCGLVGYPHIANNELECLDKCTHSITKNEIEFKINANEALQSTYSDEVETTSGYSGSGLFTKVNEEYILTGIIREVISYKNSFNCVNLSYLLKDISLDEYGGIEITTLENIDIEYSNQLQRKTKLLQKEGLETLIQEQVTKEFQELKETYLNGSEKKIHIWIEEIKTSIKWNILSNTQKAKILYEETRISIEANHLDKSEDLIREIQELDKSLYVNRLLSWIEINKNNIDKALLLLDNNEVATLNQKIAIYLEIHDFDNAQQTIDSIKIEDRNHETYRVKSIYELYTNKNNYSQALKDINKSLSLNENYTESKRIKAIILFYKSTLFTVLPNLVPPIVQNNMLKIDEESQNNIQSAYNLLENSNEYADKAWIATIKWLKDRMDAIKYIEELYKDEKYKYIAIQFVIVYSLDIDIQEYIDIMEQKIDINELYKADTLIRYYIRNQNQEKTFELLDKYKNIYIKDNKLDNWNENYVNALLNFKMDKELLSFIDTNEIREKDEIKAHIYKMSNDYQSAYKLYEELFDKTKKPIYRLTICQMKSEENDWKYITEYTDYLLKNFQTEKVVELVVLGEINSQHFNKAKKLVDEWLPLITNSSIKDSFLRIKAISENMLGNPYKAIEIYERNNLNKTQEDISNLTYLYQKTGSDEKLENLAIKSINNKNLHVDTKIQIVSMLDNNSSFVHELVKKNDIEKSDVFFIKKDSQNKHRILQKIRKLGDNEILLVHEASGEATLINIEHEAQKKHKYTLYQNSDISMHHLDSDFLHSYYRKNKKVLYIRSAKKIHFVKIKDYKNTLLYLDITSLLLLFSLDKLQLIIDSFDKVFLSSNVFFILDEINASSELKNLLRMNFKLKKLLFSPEINYENIEDTEKLSNLMISIYTLLELNKENILICADDRYVNGFQKTKNNLTIISTNDILFTLCQQYILSKDEYYSTLLEMRKRKYLYLLITSEEIIYQLKNCKIIDNQIQETEELKTLKESLKFMIQNFRYLKPFEQTNIDENQYSEPFFVINQEREINHSIIDLWNEEFEYEEDRYVYLNWIMNNMFTLNITSFIKNKLSHNNDVSRTITITEITSFFIQAITIILDKNQKLYFEWLYQNFLDNFFKANPKLVSEIIDNIASMLIKSFFRKERDKYEEVLITGLVLNFPEEIKNKLFKNKQLMTKLPFEPLTTINNFNFNNDKLMSKIKKIVNGSREEKAITTDKKNSIKLTSITIENQKHIMINNNNNQILEDTYMILSTSRQKRKKILEANPQWFNMSNSKRKQIIEEIINIQNHHDRIERLYQVQEDSKFYANIQKDLEKQRLTFDSLIPNNIDILLNHFRLTKDLPFNDSFNLSIETLLKEEDILKTIDIIHHFPISIPKKIIDILKEKSKNEQQHILNAVLKTPTTPISHIQLLRVLIAIQNKKFEKIIIYFTKKIFTENFKLELKAFFAIKNFVRQEFNLKYSSLNDNIKLALIWGHSNKLMKYFNAYMVDYNWIIKEFKNYSNKATLEVFRPDSKYNMDILNQDLSYEEFVITSISYITDNNLDYFDNSIIKRKIEELITVENYPNFIQLTHKRLNSIDSFLQLEKNSILDSLPILKEILEQTEKLPTKNNTIFITFFNLKYNFYPLNEDLQNQLIETIEKYTPSVDTEEQILLSLYNLLFFVKQLKNINNHKISKKVIQDIKDISYKITIKQQRGILFEILIYMPFKQTNDIKSRIKLISKYLQLCPIGNDDEIKMIINKLLIELPIEYSQYFLPLKFQTLYEREILDD